MNQKRQINNPKDFPDDFWNYLVNPILGYYVKPAKLSPRGVLNPKESSGKSSTSR